jgi:hypothetical protein
LCNFFWSFKYGKSSSMNSTLTLLMEKLVLSSWKNFYRI